MAKRQQAIRVAVGGPTARASAIWRAWIPAGKSDVYMAARSLASTLKISLHPTVWRHAFTSEYHRSPDRLPNVPDERTIAEWEPPQDITPGMKLAVRILVAPGPVATATDDVDIVWFSAPSLWSAFEVILTEPHLPVTDWPGRNTMNTTFIGRLQLEDGRTAWIAALHVSPWDRAGEVIDRLRRGWEKASGDPPDDIYDAEIRTILIGDSEDGSRMYVDAALPKVLRPTSGRPL